MYDDVRCEGCDCCAVCESHPFMKKTSSKILYYAAQRLFSFFLELANFDIGYIYT